MTSVGSEGARSDKFAKPLKALRVFAFARMCNEALQGGRFHTWLRFLCHSCLLQCWALLLQILLQSSPPWPLFFLLLLCLLLLLLHEAG